MMKEGYAPRWRGPPRNPELEPDYEVRAEWPGCAGQRNWRTPSRFPQCPESVTCRALSDYLAALVPGVVFHENVYGLTLAIAAAVTSKGTLSVVSQGDVSRTCNAGVCIVAVSRGVIWHFGFAVCYDVDEAMHEHQMVLSGAYGDAEIRPWRAPGWGA